jgi:hypothetical protein
MTAPQNLTQFTYDVFISYSHKNKDWVCAKLLPCLEGAGLKVLIDYRDFEIGIPSVVNMERAVDCSRHTLLVLTPSWLASEWTDFESLLTGTSDPAARRRRVVPLMLEPCNPPQRIAMLTYADFINPTRRDEEMARLIRALSQMAER